MGKNYYLKQLIKLKYLLISEGNCSGTLLSLFNSNALHPPRNICNVFKYAYEINENHSYAFFGYDAISEKELIDLYQNRSNPISFFGAYKYKKDFELAEDYFIGLGDTLEEDAKELIRIYNVKRFIPLCKFQGDYIVVDLESADSGALVIMNYGHLGTHLAPNIIEHINDLIEGLEQDVYTIEDDGIVCPTSWYLRKKMRAGERVEPRALR